MFPKLLLDGTFDLHSACGVGFVASSIGKVLHHCFTRGDFETSVKRCPTPHALRAVGLIWALRCFCDEHRAKLCGAWLGLNAKHFTKYIRGGCEKREFYSRQGKPDPIFVFWRFTDNFVCFV